MELSSQDFQRLSSSQDFSWRLSWLKSVIEYTRCSVVFFGLDISIFLGFVALGGFFTLFLTIPWIRRSIGFRKYIKTPVITNLYLILVRWPMPRFRSTRWRPCRKRFWTWTRFPEYRSELRTPRLWLPHLKNIITIDKLSSGRPKNTTLLEMPSATRGASHTWIYGIRFVRIGKKFRLCSRRRRCSTTCEVGVYLVHPCLVVAPLHGLKDHPGTDKMVCTNLQSFVTPHQNPEMAWKGKPWYYVVFLKIENIFIFAQAIFEPPNSIISTDDAFQISAIMPKLGKPEKT